MALILYVDDDPVLLELGKLFLERSKNFIVDTAVSTAEAITKLQSRNYDGIISDYQMPDMDGIAFLKYVRTHHECLPFILFTGRGREEVVIDALNNGADFYIQKGGDPTSQFAELKHRVTVAVTKTRMKCQFKESQRWTEDIINFLPDATLVIDKNGTVLEWNRAMVEMTGVPAEQMIGKSNYEYALPFYHERRPITVDLILHDDPAVVAKYPVMKKEGNSLFSEVFIPHLNKGRGAHLWFTASPLYDTAGNLTGAIESIRDITDRKITEQALHDAVLNWQSTFDSNQDAICLFDADQRIITCNRTMQEILGAKNADDLIGRYCWEVVHGTAGPVPSCPHQRMQGSLQRETMELTIGDRWFVVVTDPILDETRTLVGAVHSIRDITDRKRAEEALRESEERYRNVVEDQTEFICRFLPDGTHIFANDAYCRYFNMRREEIVGHKFRPALHPEDRDTVKHLFGTLTPTHPVVNINQRIIMPDGSLKWQQWSDRAIFDPNGRVIEYQSVGRDITEQKILEKEMEYHEQELGKFSTSLAVANKKLSLLSSITRHDILNQLMALKGYLYLSNEMIDNPTILSGYIQKEEQVADAIENQIKFTKDYQELGVAEPEWQNMNASIKKAVTGLPMRDVHVEVDPKNPAIFADRLFEKVFYNLIDNALRYGGAAMKTIRISSQEIDTCLLIVCEDDGVGISEEDKKRLFTRGFGKNTGLGLFLSREILSITGITIAENGIPGKGARFEIHVPAGLWRMKGANE